MDNRLRSIYYNPNNAAGFSSIDKLVKASGISKKKVKEWLKKQATYTLHRSARKRYPTRKYIVHKIDSQWQADLAEVQLIANKNNGNRYILTVIDLFSRYAWARPLKSKRGQDVAEAFQSIFNEGRVPERIQTDQGKEFENRHVKLLFETYNIELFSVKSAYKAAVVERFNRTLKSKLWRYFTSNLTTKWTDVLQKVVNSYNNSVHRMIGKKPIDVNDGNSHEVREKMAARKIKDTRKNDIKVGDKVRISKVKSVFAKGYLANWTEEVFTVVNINTKYKPVTYKLKDYNGDIIEGSFYRYEIQPIIEASDTYLVEKVIRTERRNHEQWCLVKWRGHPTSMNSWVRRSDIFHVLDRQ